PSLHLATAFLLVLFATRNRTPRAIACLYLACTMGATLAFEHYVIDLIVGVPFACAVAAAANRRFRFAIPYLGIVLVWLFLIRLDTPFLIQHTYLLRLFAFLTASIGIYEIHSAWTLRQPVRTRSNREPDGLLFHAKDEGLFCMTKGHESNDIEQDGLHVERKSLKDTSELSNRQS